jgi:8-oxo-dGTP pyrophosphatase MutT (NUDIX family)
MDKKTRKAQVVVAALDSKRQSFTFLLLQTNLRRGSFWQNITGKIDDGETYEEGALREAIEETGLQIDSIVEMTDLGLVHEFTDERKRNVTERSFLFIVSEPWEIKIDPSEHQAYKWVDQKELFPEIVKHQGNYEALEKSQALLRNWGA